jgi:hypothetical protein
MLIGSIQGDASKRGHGEVRAITMMRYATSITGETGFESRQSAVE